MTEWPADPTTRVTRGGETLTAAMWQALEAAYRDAGLDPDTYLVVTHGSWDHYSGSGSTHDASGAADLRVWNLPTSARADLCRVLVVALRELVGPAWYRDATHGGMDPHIHVLDRSDGALSSGARSQVRDYDAGLNGLSSGGPDYHPRPDYLGHTYTTTDDTMEDDDMFIFKSHQNDQAAGSGIGTGRAFLVHNGFAVQCDKGYTINDDVAVVSSSSEAMDSAFFKSVKTINL